MADFINEHPALKPLVRAGLLPAVSMSTVSVNTTPVVWWAVVGSLAALGAGVLAYPVPQDGLRTEIYGNIS